MYSQLAEKLEPMPEVGDHYIGADIQLQEVTELNANIIAESMYAQCDTDRNEYCS